MNILKSFRNSFSLRGILGYLVIIALIFILDRVSKVKIINHQENNDGSLFINDYLNLELVWNTGIGFGLLSHNANIYYHGISFLILFVIFFLIYIINKVGFFEKILYSLILGGALGNFFDRVIYYAVPDFIDFHIHDFHWFTFNIADIFITIGVILLITKDLILNKK